MTSWREFARAAPDMAEFGASRLTGRISYLATIRADGSPRVHPVSSFIGGGRLFIYMEPSSPKGRDLRRDSRYSLHCSVEDNEGGGGEFCIAGRAAVIEDDAGREAAFQAARDAGYSPRDRYVVFEMSIESALATTYPDGKPSRKRWKSGQSGRSVIPP